MIIILLIVDLQMELLRIKTAIILLIILAITLLCKASKDSSSSPLN